MVKAPGITARVLTQQARIDWGKQKGFFTEKEQAKLNKFDNACKPSADKFTADGVLTGEERLAAHGALGMRSTGIFLANLF